MRLSRVVVPFIALALACATSPAPKPKHARVPGSYAIVIDSRASEQPLIGGSGAASSHALYALHQVLQNTFEKITFLRKAPKKVKPYEAVIIVTPPGESTIAGIVPLSWTVQKCDAADQRGMLTYDVNLNSFGGLRQLVRDAAPMQFPSAASAASRR